MVLEKKTFPNSDTESAASSDPVTIPNQTVASNQSWDELEEFKPTEISLHRSGQVTRSGILLGMGAGIAIAIAGMLVFGAISRPKPADAPAAHSGKTEHAIAESVTVATATDSSITQRIEVTGTVAATDMLSIAAQATGLQVQQVLVEEGDRVSSGQVLAVLDHAVLQAQLNEAQAELASAQAQIRQKQAMLAQEQSTLTEAESNVQRYRMLANEGAETRQELETRETTVATAQAAIQAARAEVNSAQAAAQSNIAQIQRLETQLEQTLVRAPAAGIVAEKPVRIGDVTGADVMFSIIQNGSLELQAAVTADQLPQVRVGALVQVRSDVDPRIQLQGRVREIAPLVNSQTRQATVKIDLPSHTFIRPGTFLRAAINTSSSQGLMIPAKATLPQADGSFIVYVLSGDIARARKVQLGMRQNLSHADQAQVEVKNGLNDGDRVIISGVGYLKDGDRVRVIGG